MVNLVIGIVLMFVSGFLFARIKYDGGFDSDSLAVTLLGVAVMLCVVGSCQMLQSSDYVIDALNNTLQYDTVCVDKEGKLLKIKIK